MGKLDLKNLISLFISMNNIMADLEMQVFVIMDKEKEYFIGMLALDFNEDAKKFLNENIQMTDEIIIQPIDEFIDNLKEQNKNNEVN